MDLNEAHMNQVTLTIKENERALRDSIKDILDKSVLRIKQAEQYTTDKV
jgi:hypothetical protein